MDTYGGVDKLRMDLLQDPAPGRSGNRERTDRQTASAQNSPLTLWSPEHEPVTFRIAASGQTG